MKKYFFIICVSLTVIIFFAKTISMFDDNLIIIPNEVQAVSNEAALLSQQPSITVTPQQLNNKKHLPVLMYHLVEKLPAVNGYLYVTREKFEEQIKYLAENGYTFLLPEQIPQAGNYQKPVVITFDDGYFNNYYNAYPILKKYGAKATIFVIAGKIGERQYCSADQLKEMSDSGFVRIGSHTYSHVDLRKLSAEKARWEFETSRNIIYNITKSPVSAVSFPYGYYTNETLQEAGKIFDFGFGVYSSKKQTAINIGRLTVTNDKTLDAFMQLLGE